MKLAYDGELYLLVKPTLATQKEKACKHKAYRLY